MAIGTGTVAVRTGHDNRGAFIDLVSFAGDSSYPTGGTAGFEASMRAAIGRGNIDVVGVIGQDCGGYVPVYDRANDKLKVYFVNNDGASDGPMIEVAGSTDLSGVTFRVLVVSV